MQGLHSAAGVPSKRTTRRSGPRRGKDLTRKLPPDTPAPSLIAPSQESAGACPRRPQIHREANRLESATPPPRALTLPLLAAAPGRARRAEAGAAVVSRRRAARLPGPRSLLPSCLRPGRPRPGAPRSYRTNTPRVPAVPHTPGARSPPRCRRPGWAGRRPARRSAPGDAAREARGRPWRARRRGRDSPLPGAARLRSGLLRGVSGSSSSTLAGSDLLSRCRHFRPR